jgi:hypothetical protein
MNYEKMYRDLCLRGQGRVLEGYVEKHHIQMRSRGGSDGIDNITHLTAREHFIAHWLLARMYPNDYKAQAAFRMMANVRGVNRYTPSSRAVAEARESAAKLHSQLLTGRKVPREQVERRSATRRGVKQSETTKQRRSESLRGRERIELRGRLHINNGQASKMIHRSTLEHFLNNGWKKGRLPQSESTKTKRSVNNSRRRWINNGTHNRYGYIKGKLTHK